MPLACGRNQHLRCLLLPRMPNYRCRWNGRLSILKTLRLLPLIQQSMSSSFLLQVPCRKGVQLEPPSRLYSTEKLCPYAPLKYASRLPVRQRALLKSNSGHDQIITNRPLLLKLTSSLGTMHTHPVGQGGMKNQATANQSIPCGNQAINPIGSTWAHPFKGGKGLRAFG